MQFRNLIYYKKDFTFGPVCLVSIVAFLFLTKSVFHQLESRCENNRTTFGGGSDFKTKVREQKKSPKTDSLSLDLYLDYRLLALRSARRRATIIPNPTNPIRLKVAGSGICVQACPAKLKVTFKSVGPGGVPSSKSART